MRHEMALRLATPEDLEFIIGALAESAYLTVPRHRWADISAPALRARQMEELQRHHGQDGVPEELLIAEISGRPIGLLWITTEFEGHEQEKVAWILGIYVIEEERGNGHGAELMRRAERWARAHGLKEIWLRVGPDNGPALGLYESAGYSIEDLHLSKRV
jgi:GNAT superfamily N-acetyltransferase